MKDLEGWFCRWWMKLDKKLQLDDLRRCYSPARSSITKQPLRTFLDDCAYGMVGGVKELNPTGDEMLFCEDWVLGEFSKTTI